MPKKIASTSQKSNDWSVLRRLWAYLRQDWHLLLIILGILIVVSISRAVAPALIGVAIDQYITADDRDGLANTMLFLLAIYVLGWIGFMGQI